MSFGLNSLICKMETRVPASLGCYEEEKGKFLLSIRYYPRVLNCVYLIYQPNYLISLGEPLLSWSYAFNHAILPTMGQSFC